MERAPCPLRASLHGLKTGLKPSSSHTWILNPTFSVSLRLVRVLSAHPPVCLSRGSGGHALGASQTSARLSTTRTSLPGPAGTSPASARLSPLRHWGACGPFPAVPQRSAPPHCPGLSFPREAPAPLTPSPPPGFSHFLFGFGSFVLESHSRETQPGRTEQGSDRGRGGNCPAWLRLECPPSGGLGSAARGWSSLRAEPSADARCAAMATGAPSLSAKRAPRAAR